MGKATILSSLGAGQYRIKVEFDNARAQARLTAIAQQLADLAPEIADLDGKAAEALAGLQEAVNLLNLYLQITPAEQYAQDPSYLNELTKYVYDWRRYYDQAKRNADRAKLKKLGLEKDKQYIEKFAPSDFETDAWCVEHKEDLTGTTKTIECDYLLKRNPDTNAIQDDTGIWLPAAIAAPDAQMQHPLASSVHATWFNLCMAPAMQRYKGQYRIGTITSIDAEENTCDMTLAGVADVNESSDKLATDQPILPNVNGAQSQYITGANIVYGTCHAAAFLVGDKVIVDLHSGAGTPTVIGFYSHPRQCADYTFTSNLINVATGGGNSYMQASGNYDFEHNDLRINPGDYAVTMNGNSLPYSPLSGGGAQWGDIIGDGILYFRLLSSGQFSVFCRDNLPSVQINLLVTKAAETVIDMMLTADSWPSTTGGNDVLDVGMTCSQPTALRKFGAQLPAITMIYI